MISASNVTPQAYNYSLPDEPIGQPARREKIKNVKTQCSPYIWWMHA